MYTYHLRKRETQKGHSWQIIIEGDPDPLTGKRNRNYKTVTCTKKEADAEALKMINQLNSGGLIKQSALRLEDWMKQWLELYLPNIEFSTRKSYEERTKTRILPILGKIPLNTLSNTMIQGWVNTLQKTLSPKSVRNVYNILNKALKQAVALAMIFKNPCEGTVLPKQNKYQSNVYSQANIQTALSLAKGTDMYLPLVLEFAIGMRRGELLSLTWSDIDFEKCEININKSLYVENGEYKTKEPKTKSGIRTVSFGPKVLNALQIAHDAYLERKQTMGTHFKDHDLVVCKADGTYYHPDSMSTKWDRFKEKHGLPDIRFHDLRHTNATTLMASGVPAKTVQQRLGHSDITTTLNIYVHCTKQMNQSAATKIDQFII